MQPNPPAEVLLEALLFYRDETISWKEASEFLNLPPAEVRQIAEHLMANLANRGVCLVMSEQELGLRAPLEVSEKLAKLTREELARDLTKASLETLTVIIYRRGATRAEIDYLRGVNSTVILRQLMIRGLVDKQPNPNNPRSYVYQPSIELLAHLGVNRVDDLPDFNQIEEKLAEIFNKSPETNEVQ